LRSIEGDDDVAHDMTRALRAAVEAAVSWQASDREVSMTQMALAHGCDEVDAACLAQIAESLEADIVVYGTLRRTSAKTEYDYELGLSMFSKANGAIERSITETIPRGQAGFRSFGEHAESLLRKLANEKQQGAIVVAVNTPSATVFVDGVEAGTATGGVFRLEEVEVGERRVDVQAEGHAQYSTRVSVVAGEDANVNAQLVPVQTQAAVAVDSGSVGGGSLEWLGWTLVGVSAASLVGVGVSALVVSGVEDDDLYQEYRDRIARDNALAGMTVVDDICEEADAGLPHGLSNAEVVEVADLCSKADTFEVLQWVFLGTAVVAGGAGAYILLTDDGGDSDEAARKATFALRPSFGRDSAHLQATLRF